MIYSIFVNANAWKFIHAVAHIWIFGWMFVFKRFFLSFSLSCARIKYILCVAAYIIYIKSTRLSSDWSGCTCNICASVRCCLYRCENVINFYRIFFLCMRLKHFFPLPYPFFRSLAAYLLDLTKTDACVFQLICSFVISTFSFVVIFCCCVVRPNSNIYNFISICCCLAQNRTFNEPAICAGVRTRKLKLFLQKKNN